MYIVQIISGSMLLFFIAAFIVGLIKPNWIKFKTGLQVFIAFAIVLVFFSGITYINLQDDENALISQAQAVFEHKQSIDHEKDQTKEPPSADKIEGVFDDTQTKKSERSIKDEISSKIRLELSVDNLVIDSHGDTKVRLVIINTSDYQIDKMKIRIALKDSNGNTVDDYDCEIVQPVNAHGVLGDTLWMNVKGVVDQRTNISIVEYSKPAQ